MKLERIALTEFRRFRETLVLDGLADGLNIFVGANEAGKSTVAAAVRAAFLERFKTRTVADFAPWGHAAARPSVELAFRIGGRGYRLHKTFLNRPRCELQIDGAARLEGEQAEDVLAALLGFDFPAKGQSRPEHGGVPGLLWIQQGESQHLAGPAGHAGAHLREALARLSGELASSGGDRLHERVAAERAALFHARTGRPIGAFREAEDALADALQRHATLAAAKAALDADVDLLGALQRAHAEAKRDEPWRAFEAAARQACERLAAIDKERDAAAEARRRLAAADATLALLDQQVARDRQDADALQAAADDTVRATAAAAEATDALARARTAQRHQADAVAAIGRQLDAARAAAERLDLDGQIDREAREVARLDAALAEATALAAGLPALHAEAHRNAIAAADVAALRKIEQACGDLALRRQAGATRLGFRLTPGAQAMLDGMPLDGDGERALAAPAVLDVPGVGRFDIAPGGRDLPKLRADAERADAERAALLRRLAVASLADAEARQRLHERALADIDGVGQRPARRSSRRYA